MFLWADRLPICILVGAQPSRFGNEVFKSIPLRARLSHHHSNNRSACARRRYPCSFSSASSPSRWSAALVVAGVPSCALWRSLELTGVPWALGKNLPAQHSTTTNNKNATSARSPAAMRVLSRVESRECWALLAKERRSVVSVGKSAPRATCITDSSI